MNLYPFIQPLLFKLDPETAHHVTLKSLEIIHQLRLDKLIAQTTNHIPVSVMGLEFKNPVGLAAGLDKNGDYIDALAALGFGFIEVGTVTPRPQPGNPKPRMFRIPEHQAIINRMGFNNLGIDHLIEQVKKSKFQGILGINIGKNVDTPIEKATADYLTGLSRAYPWASYITINISSPNTKNLRQLQQGDEIKKLLGSLKEKQAQLHEKYARYVPLAVKIAPDLSSEEVAHIADLLIELELDGVIATNTTINRDKIAGHPYANESGGLSGAPVKEAATAIVAKLNEQLAGKVPIIAVGGIMSDKDAQEKISAGASLVQIYSGLIYKGPALVSEIIRSI